jgi:hypothetical protein
VRRKSADAQQNHEETGCTASLGHIEGD